MYPFQDDALASLTLGAVLYRRGLLRLNATADASHQLTKWEGTMPTTDEQKIKIAKVLNRFATVLGVVVVPLALWSVVSLARGGSPAIIVIVLVLIIPIGGLVVVAQNMIKQTETKEEDH